MFLTGPAVVRDALGEEVGVAELGGPRVHDRNGVCHLVAPSDLDALLLTRELLDYLPQRAGERPADWPGVAAPGEAPDLTVPQQERKVYDVRDVARAIVDGGRLLEISPRYARNVVCAFARIEGRPVGAVANQPQSMAGTLDIAASQKGARFVAFCDAFNLPLITLVDTPGFMPGKDLEWRGMIRHGAQLVFAYAEATVPRVCLIMRKAFGGAYIVMDSKQMGNDLCLAWPSTQVAVTGEPGTVQILHRQEDPATKAGIIEASRRPTSPRTSPRRGPQARQRPL